MNVDTTAFRRSGEPTRWHRLRYSPLRDVVRGRLTGRLNWKRRIAESGLPTALQGLVLDVTRRTRLSGLERSDLAEELIAHFQDGLARDVPAEDLAIAFGDTRSAAKLIARARKRTRSPLVRAATRTLQATGLALGLVIVLYLVSAVQFFFARPAPKIDYRPQINATALAVPEADRAWPLYRQALLALPDAPKFSDVSNRAPRPGEEGWERLAGYLQGNDAELARVRRAASMPGLGFVTGYELSEGDRELWPDIQFSESDIEEGGMYALLLPHLSELRHLARLLGHDARRAATIEDGATVMSDFESMLGITRQLREAPFLINDLVALAIFRLTLDIAGEVLAEHPDVFDDGQLRRFAHLLATFDDAHLRVRIEGERLGFADIVQRVYSDDGEGDGYLTAQGCRMLLRLTGSEVQDMSEGTIIFAGPALRGVMLSRRELFEQLDWYLNELSVYAATPLWERETADAETQLELWNTSLLSRMRHFPLVMLMPALSRASVQADVGMQHRDAILAAIALRLYERRTGHWPESLEAISPSLLPTPPVDRFDGGILRYVVRDARPLLYSVGVDRDDDDGRVHKDAFQWRPPSVVAAAKSGESTVRVPDGDWQLWPPVIDPLVVHTPESPIGD